MAKPKPKTLKRTRRSKPKPASGYAHLVESIGGLIDAARQRVAQTVNTEMVRLYWEIGRHIVEYEQGGSDRAQYGARLLEHLSADLTQRYGRGFSLRNLRNFRLLYQAFPIRQALPAELTWTHLLLILRVEEPLAREFYVKQCQRERWSSARTGTSNQFAAVRAAGAVPRQEGGAGAGARGTTDSAADRLAPRPVHV